MKWLSIILLIAANSLPITTNAGNPGLNECQTMKSEWILCNDFDTSVTTDAQRHAQWDNYDGAVGTNFPLDPGPSQDTSNHVAQFRAPAGASGGTGLVKVLPSTYDKLYARWYTKFETGFNFNAPEHQGGFHGGSRDYLGSSDNRPDGTNWFSAWVDYTNSSPFNSFFYTYYRGMYQQCTNPVGSCWGDSLPCSYGSSYCSKPQHLPVEPRPNLQADRWYCVETMLDAGTPTPTASGANGVLQLWIDGQSLGSWNDLWFRTTPNLKITLLWLMLYQHDGSHSIGGVLYDNVVVSTSRVGCTLGSSYISSAPTNLHIVQ